jgi:hypothetical protein
MATAANLAEPIDDHHVVPVAVEHERGRTVLGSEHRLDDARSPNRAETCLLRKAKDERPTHAGLVDVGAGGMSSTPLTMKPSDGS